MMTRENFFLGMQRGGMLLELMLSVALASVIIPFVFRYQKNTIERARNIAVVRQMEIVRNSLERCIFENREKIIVQANSVFTEDNTISDIDCLILSNCTKKPDGYECPDITRGLINYGLSIEFAMDFSKDYKLRILKKDDHTGQPILQGVVLLTGQDINALRTREIVKLGGDKSGFVDGDNIQGGYNTFKAGKEIFGMGNITQGIIQTTDTMRGYSKYLWRLPSGSEDDATMLSHLNLDGHDIVNIGGLYAYQTDFNKKLTVPTAGNLSASSIFFNKLTNLDSGAHCNGNSSVSTAEIDGDLVFAGGTLNIIGAKPELILKDRGEFSECELKNFISNKDLMLSDVKINSNKLTVSGQMSLPTINTAGEIIVNNAMVVPRLIASGKICVYDETSGDGCNKNYYWQTGKSSKAKFNDVDLTGMKKMENTDISWDAQFPSWKKIFKNVAMADDNEFGQKITNIKQANEDYGLYSKSGFFNQKGVPTVDTVGDMLVALENLKWRIERKYRFIDVCTLENYDNVAKRFCVENGKDYLKEGTSTEYFDLFYRVMSECHDLYGAKSATTSTPEWQDLYNSHVLPPDPGVVVNRFGFCLFGLDKIGQESAYNYISAYIKCSHDTKQCTNGSTCNSCIDYEIAHPK